MTQPKNRKRNPTIEEIHPEIGERREQMEESGLNNAKETLLSKFER